jgi:3D-(3,5/4)-trihydroxycyclohexane-1,2-dione acylhydrolase (decyclizing)
MLANEIITSIQEGYKLTILLMDNSGFNSIGGLSRSLGQGGFGTRYAYPKNQRLPSDEDGDEVRELPVDLAMSAQALGAHVIKCETLEEFRKGFEESKNIDRTTVVYIRNDRYVGVPGYETWWDVPVAEVSEMESVRESREQWSEKRPSERYFL